MGDLGRAAGEERDHRAEGGDDGTEVGMALVHQMFLASLASLALLACARRRQESPTFGEKYTTDDSILSGERMFTVPTEQTEKRRVGSAKGSAQIGCILFGQVWAYSARQGARGHASRPLTQASHS